MLGKRLNTIVSFCGKPSRIADVGCDHGYVLKELANNGVQFLIASDISAPSVKKADDLLKSINYSNYDVRVGDGLSTLTDEDHLDLIVIAGMGGYEIIEILSKSKIKLNYLVLQPQNNVVLLRQYLMNNNFIVIKDWVVKDNNKFYNVLKVKKSDKIQTLSQKDITYGVTNLLEYNSDFVEMLMYENAKMTERLQRITNENTRQKFEIMIANNNYEINSANNRR